MINMSSKSTNNLFASDGDHQNQKPNYSTSSSSSSSSSSVMKLFGFAVPCNYTDDNPIRDHHDDHNNKKQQRFECPFCGKEFGSSQALGGHQNAHRGERNLTKLAKTTQTRRPNHPPPPPDHHHHQGFAVLGVPMIIAAHRTLIRPSRPPRGPRCAIGPAARFQCVSPLSESAAAPHYAVIGSGPSNYDNVRSGPIRARKVPHVSGARSAPYATVMRQGSEDHDHHDHDLVDLHLRLAPSNFNVAYK